MFSLMIRPLVAPASLLLGIFALPPAPRELEIVGLDYAFTAPSELPGGLPGRDYLIVCTFVDAFGTGRNRTDCSSG